MRDDEGRTIGYAEPAHREPPLCPVFSHKMHERRHVDKKGNDPKGGFVDEKVVTETAAGFATDYATARRPMADLAAIPPLRDTVAEIDGLYVRARACLGRGRT